MIKKLGFCLIASIIAVIAALFFPWHILSGFKNTLFGGGDQFSSLKVYSLGGDMKIYIDGDERGVVREEDTYVEIFPVTLGEHEVSLKRVATMDGFYQEFSREVSFVKGFDSSISWELGPTVDSSSGWILYANKRNGAGNEVTLNVLCKPTDCSLILDDTETKPIATTTFSVSLDSQHKIKVEREGYQPLEISFLPDDEQTRSKLKDYELFLEVNLYKIPL